MSNAKLPRLAGLIVCASVIAAVLPMQQVAAQGSSTFFETLFGDQSGGPDGNYARSYYQGGRSGRQTISISNRYAPGQIIVSFADRHLYYIRRRGRAISYPIAVPQSRASWQGVLRISSKKVNPSWTPTADMRRENPSLPAYVPGGHPRNPLGYRALYLGSSLYRIHGTDAPWTIGKSVSHGCIRMYNADVEDLYGRVHIGTKVTVTQNGFASNW
jgi:lipoprotein-anchoring transpeptidase ErfK/SrfK